jgi:hypothetical protein
MCPYHSGAKHRALHNAGRVRILGGATMTTSTDLGQEKLDYLLRAAAL